MVGQLRRLVGWFLQVLGWLLYSARRVWVAVLIPVAIALFAWHALPRWESRLRISGLFLQVAGVLTVAKGLHDTRKLFGRPSLRQHAVRWFKQFPRFGVDTPMAVGSGSGSSTGSSIGSAMILPGPAASLEERVASLAQELIRTSGLVQETRQRLAEESRDRGREIDSERCERRSGDERVRQLIEEAAAGGLHLELTGVVWLLLGVVLSTAPNEIIAIFQ